jgi:hypothetical protein
MPDAGSSFSLEAKTPRLSAGHHGSEGIDKLNEHWSDAAENRF